MTDDGRSGAGPTADAEDAAEDDAETAHLADVEDGCGCTEVWEYLSERRDAER